MKARLGMFALVIVALAGLIWTSAAAPVYTLPQKTAVTSTTGAKMPTHSSTGTITSINPKHMVISSWTNGKQRHSNFTLNPSTRKTGKLAVGDKVTVHYHVANKRNVATSVREFKPARG